MKIYLLTHPRELPKATNTGQLVLAELGDRAERIIWSRVEPDAGLLREIESQRAALVYPGEEAVTAEQLQTEFPTVTSLILLDGTWQEARKMYNKSAYLHDLPRVSFVLTEKSRYQLRRNQKAEGLCTAESVAHLLEGLRLTETADGLNTRLAEFTEGFINR